MPNTDRKKTAIVTGGAQRIGRAIAIHLANCGYNIILHYNSSQSKAESVANEIQAHQVGCSIYQCDFNNLKQVSSFIHDVYPLFPNCCLLVNNASIFERSRLLDTDMEFFDRHFNINFKTPLFLSRDFARQCSNGQIINLIDTKASRILIEYFAYTLSKKALFEFTRMAAKELAPSIRVNGICPGFILPPSGEDHDDTLFQERRIPLQRRGGTESIVSAVTFLLDNDFITGETIFVDGGEQLK